MVNSYILRDGVNRIKSLYVLRYDDPGADISRAADDYLTIAKDEDGYWAYNAFNKNTVVIRKYQGGQYFVKTNRGVSSKQCKPGEYIKLKANEAINLKNGDFIYFEMDITIDVGGRTYSFVRMARLLEEAQ